MPKGKRRALWDADGVRTLRAVLSMTQQQLADELGVRQQTVSEWETGVYGPRGASERLLTIVAERAGLAYDARLPAGERASPGPEGRGKPEARTGRARRRAASRTKVASAGTRKAADGMTAPLSG